MHYAVHAFGPVHLALCKLQRAGLSGRIHSAEAGMHRFGALTASEGWASLPSSLWNVPGGSPRKGGADEGDPDLVCRISDVLEAVLQGSCGVTTQGR